MKLGKAHAHSMSWYAPYDLPSSRLRDAFSSVWLPLEGEIEEGPGM